MSYVSKKTGGKAKFDEALCEYRKCEYCKIKVEAQVPLFLNL